MKIRNSHVVVTGASRGVGEATAREIARLGGRVSLIARSPKPLKALASELGGHAFPADLGDLSALPELLQQIEDEAGPIDILVNNAAVAYTGPYLQQDPDNIELHINANLLSPMLLSRLVIPRMIERGKGNIVMVSSVAGDIAGRHVAAYGGSKAGLSMFTANLQRELSDSPVTITLSVLGEIETQMLEEGRKDPVLAANADKVGAMGTLTPEEVALDIIYAIENNSTTRVLPKAAWPVHWIRQRPSRLMDFVLRDKKK